MIHKVLNYLKQYSLFRILLLFFIPIFGLPSVQGKDLMFSNSKPILVYDITLDNGKLRSYRNVVDCLHEPEKFANNNMQGFATLKISGSAQFSAQQLSYIFERSEGQLFILDLRQETHGFINERAFALRDYRNQVNIGKTPEQINQEEKKLLTKIARQQTVILHEIHKYEDGSFVPIKDLEVKVKSAFTEQELIQQTQANYVRFYVLDKHKPDDEQVDAFVNFEIGRAHV